ncbi:hypothetical protein PLICRDRAFT_175344 [Plicaturopsis crispa FD-325 SS-3]|nr:hypothetical protein PLICRDRAFT_175344 [Plicaturopsis crispa FD-325 SS-3]
MPAGIQFRRRRLIVHEKNTDELFQKFVWHTHGLDPAGAKLRPVDGEKARGDGQIAAGSFAPDPARLAAVNLLPPTAGMQDQTRRSSPNAHGRGGKYVHHAQTLAAHGKDTYHFLLASDPALKQSSHELRTLLECFANGRTISTITDARTNESLRAWFASLDTHARRVLSAGFVLKPQCNAQGHYLHKWLVAHGVIRLDYDF